MPTIRRHFSYANVMSTLAVFLVLGGATAFAASHLAKNSVGTKQLKKNAVTGAKVRDGSLSGSDVDASSLGKVPSAKVADSASTAATAATAAGLAPPEELHVVGKPGEPAFSPGWGNFFPTGEGAAFYMDHEGVVHLQGRIERSAGAEQFAFVLPRAYAPAETQTFLVPSGTPGSTLVVFGGGGGGVSVTGIVSGQSIFIDGITWRAGH